MNGTATTTGERGWVCKHDMYGVWFLSFDAVKAERMEALKHENEPPQMADSDVETWFHQQCGWVEVAARGVQLEKPDMAAWEQRFYSTMREDGERVEDAVKVSDMAMSGAKK